MNTLFPGYPNYVGPVEGLFSLLHHEILVEESHDVMERIIYIKNHKPRNEVSIRLHNIMYLGNCEAAKKYKSLEKEYWFRRKDIDEEYWYKYKHLDDEYRAERKHLTAAYESKRKHLDDEYWAERKHLTAACESKRKTLENEILKYIKQYISDCAWDGKSLVF